MPSGEIDIVARDGVTTVFVEVRTRRGDIYGTAAESISPSKAKHMVASAYEYLEQRGLDGGDWRIDLVAVSLDARGKLMDIEHIPSAVEG